MTSKTVTRQKTFYNTLYGPLLVANLLANGITLMSDLIADIIGGNMIGEQAVSAVALTSPLYILICFFGYIVSIGAPVLYSQTYGKFELDHAYKIFGQSVITAAIIGIFSATFLKWFAPRFYAFYGASDEMVEMAQEYFRFFVIVALIYPLYVLLQYIVYQDGDTKLCVLSMISQFVTNIIVGLILTAKMGITGLGIGTVSGVVMSALVLCIHFFKKTNAVRLKIGWEWKILSLSVKLGLYASIVYILSIAISVISNKYIITNFGEEFIPVYTSIGLLINLSLLFQSFATAATPLISVYYGEGNTNGIKRVMNSVLKYSLISGAGFGLIALVFAKVFPTIIGITTPEVFENSVLAVREVAFSFIGAALFCLLEGYYSVMRKSILSLTVAMTSSTVVPLAMSITCMSKFGVHGMGIGYSVGSVISFVIIYLIVRLRFGKGSFPFLIKGKQSNVHIFDLNVDNESIVRIRDKASEIFKEAGMSEDNVKRAELVVEEALIRVRDENEGKKIIAELSIIVGDDIQLIIKDTGKLFDMTDIDCAVTSLNRYVLALSIESIDKKIYALTSGYNRNSFVFSRN